jgi:hypothetical protein
LALNIGMKDYIVMFTPGAFGHFMCYLIDCHKQGKVLPAPFVSAGASHNEPYDRTTFCYNLVAGDGEDMQRHLHKEKIGCVFDPEWFHYMLHAFYGRVNDGQYGKCAVTFMQNDFYEFVRLSDADLQADINDLKSQFDFHISEHNRKVPRHVLRLFFWIKMIEWQKHILVKENDRIKNHPGVDLIDIPTILDYDKLSKFFIDRFHTRLDFRQVHETFIEMNRSLKEYRHVLTLFEAIKSGKNMAVGDLTVIGEAMLLYRIEEHFFDVPFYNQIDLFTSTGQVIDYVKHFPNLLRQPNKLFHTHYKNFRPQRHEQ